METDNSMFGFGVTAVAAIPAIAFALHDFVFQLPDNQHEPTLGVFITVGGLLFVWGFGGYLAAPRVGGFAAAMKSGAVAGVMSVGILWLASIVLNNLFIDRMSYEPDTIRSLEGVHEIQDKKVGPHRPRGLLHRDVASTHRS